MKRISASLLTVAFCLSGVACAERHDGMERAGHALDSAAYETGQAAKKAAKATAKAAKKAAKATAKAAKKAAKKTGEVVEKAGEKMQGDGK